jgi:hypothetical protein
MLTGIGPPPRSREWQFHAERGWFWQSHFHLEVDLAGGKVEREITPRVVVRFPTELLFQIIGFEPGDI